MTEGPGEEVRSPMMNIYSHVHIIFSGYEVSKQKSKRDLKALIDGRIEKARMTLYHELIEGGPGKCLKKK